MYIFNLYLQTGDFLPCCWVHPEHALLRPEALPVDVWEVSPVLLEGLVQGLGPQDRVQDLGICEEEAFSICNKIKSTVR